MHEGLKYSSYRISGKQLRSPEIFSLNHQQPLTLVVLGIRFFVLLPYLTCETFLEERYLPALPLISFYQSSLYSQINGGSPTDKCFHAN